MQQDRYKYYCQTEGKFIIENVDVGDDIPTKCKNNSNHAVDWTSLTIFKKAFRKSNLGLSNVKNIKDITINTSPTVTDDINNGYSVGSKWINKSNGKVWICVNSDVNSAIWKELNPDLTGLNIGIGGIGIFKSINNNQFQFKNLNSGSNKLSIIDDNSNNEVDIDIIEANLNITNMSGGPSGTIVGTSDTQTLSNKTLITPKINDISADHTYIFSVSELTANRTIKLPLLTANDTFVFENYAQTLTNKTINTSNNTLTIAASDVTSGAFSNARISASNVVQHEGSINHNNLLGYDTNEHLNWLVDQGSNNIHINNITSDAIIQHEGSITIGNLIGSPTGSVVGISDSQTLTNKTLISPIITAPQINDISSNHQYIFAVNELTSDRTITLPLLTNNDTFVFKDHTETLTNKTINTSNNTLIIAANDISSGTFDDARIAISNIVQHEGSITIGNLYGAPSGSVLGTSDTQTLTNKTIDSTTNTVTADKLHSATTTITISSATAPINGQVLTATSSTTANWQTLSGGGGSGDVNGPVSSLDLELPVFSGTGGKRLIGSGVRHYGANDTDPNTPIPQAGDMYYNTAIDHLMCYDGTRSKWLSMTSVIDGAGRNGNTNGNTFYKRWNGMSMSETLGPYVPKGTLIYIGFGCATSGIHTLEVLVGGVVVAELSSAGAAAANSSSINADFDAGIMSFKNKVGSASTSNFQCVVYYKFRA